MFYTFYTANERGFTIFSLNTFFAIFAIFAAKLSEEVTKKEYR